jgi:hypothetical protein
LIAATLVLCVSMGSVWAAPRPGATIDSKVVKDATDLYTAAQWSKAIELLSTALSAAKKQDMNWSNAQVLLLRCQIKSADAIGARQTLEKLVTHDRKWKPDASALPADEIASIEQMLPEVEVRPPFPWWWYAAGAAAAVGVVVWCPWCPDHTDQLPAPPPPPSGAGR